MEEVCRGLRADFPERQHFMTLTNSTSPASADGLAGEGAPRHNHALPPGFRLNEYELIRVLGQGGFGIVYLARDDTLGRQVAIKEYLPVALATRGNDGVQVVARSTSSNKRFQVGLKAFVQEARLLARFDHPALVSIHRFWEANGTSYMVMPYYEGSTLMETRQSLGRPPTETWLRVTLTSILGALDLLHKADCVHRDISPENILVMPDGRTVLLDFAVLPVSEDSVGQHTTILKPAWAPIEQFAQSTHLPQGPWSDIYSLGAVAYYCVTGQPPPPATVRALDPGVGRTPLAQVMPDIMAQHPEARYPAYLIEAIDWALSVRPSDRPQSAQALRDMLSKHKREDAPAMAPASAAAPATPPAAAPAAAGPSPASAPDLRGGPAVHPAGPKAGAVPGAAASAQAAAAGGTHGAAGGEGGHGDVAPAANPKDAAIDASIREAIGVALQGFENVRSAPRVSLPNIGGLEDEPSRARAHAAGRIDAPPLTASTLGARPGGGHPAGVRAAGPRASAGKRKLPWQMVAAAAAVVVGMTVWIGLPQWQASEDEAQAMRKPVPAERSDARPGSTTNDGRTVANRADDDPLSPRATVGDARRPIENLPAPGLGRPTAAEPVRSLDTPGQLTNPTVAPAPETRAPLGAAPVVPPPDAADLPLEPRKPAPTVARAAPVVAPAGPAAAASAQSTVRRVEVGRAGGSGGAAAAPRAANNANEGDEPPVKEVASATSPRSACGDRTNFSLQRCMQSQCQTGRWVLHPQCSKLRSAGGEWVE